MQDLSWQRCLNHGSREAVARCPECRHFFCRECIVEHEDRVLCATCLAKLARPTVARRLRLATLVRLSQGLLGILAAWLFFYCLGRGLLTMPDAFHEGTLWRSGLREDQ